MKSRSTKKICHCGSGRPYSQCHGAKDRKAKGAVSRTEKARELYSQALSHAGQGDLEGAVKHLQQALRWAPDEASIVQSLAVILLKQGDAAAALPLTVRANRLVQWREEPMTRDLNFAVRRLVTRMGTGDLLQMRDRMNAGDGEPVAPPQDVDRNISCVAPLPDTPERLSRLIEELSRQSLRCAELVLVAGPDLEPQGRSPIPPSAGDAPFDVRLVHSAGATLPELLDTGIRAAHGPWVQPLTAADRFSPERLERMLQRLGESGALWGFGHLVMVDRAGDPLDRDDRPDLTAQLITGERVVEEETAGFACVNPLFAGLQPGNMCFQQELYLDLNGFLRDCSDPFRDFALRALWQAEPVYAPDAVCRHPAGAVPAADAGSYRRFYQGCYARQAPSNPTAPWCGHWGHYLLLLAQRYGHLALLPDVALDRLVRDVAKAPKERIRKGGINFVGHIRGEWGLCEIMRNLVRSSADGGIPTAVQDLYIPMPSRQGNRSCISHVRDRLPYSCSVFNFNPDIQAQVIEYLGEDILQDHYNIGYWFWELERLPREWDYAFGLVDEIWVASDFVGDAVRKNTDKPVVKIPVPIHADAPMRTYHRADFGLSDDAFVFLYSFDFNSFIERKNPQAVIDAFNQAFVDTRDPVLLVIKSSHGSKHPVQLRALQDRAGGDPRIRFINETLSYDRLLGLQTLVDCFVSLHRSEGLGLGMAECMARGKPVIATAYSGNLDFMNEENSCLVPYTRRLVEPGEYPYDVGDTFWADADFGVAAQHMRRLAQDPGFARELGEKARLHIAENFSAQRCAEHMRNRLQQLGLL
jgi:glycosyltransferase involved in cell wall biosynthesis